MKKNAEWNPVLYNMQNETNVMNNDMVPFTRLKRTGHRPPFGS